MAIRRTNKLKNKVSNSAAKWFMEDPFYRKLDQKISRRFRKIKSIFFRSIDICDDYGFFEFVESGNEIIGFVHAVDYKRVKEDPESFNFLFTEEHNPDYIPPENPSIPDLVTKYTEGTDDCIYILSIGVHPDIRKNGLGLYLLQRVFKEFTRYKYLYADITNKELWASSCTHMTILETIQNFSFVRYENPYFTDK